MQSASVLQEAIAAFQRGDLRRSRDLAEQGLSEETSADLLHLIGLIECSSGRTDLGANWLRRAVDAEPDNAGFRVMLARALVDSSRPAEALEVAQPPTGHSPAELALWHIRAEAADAVQAWDLSAKAWGLLGAARSGEWRAWSNQARALGELGRWVEAAAALKRAADANPSELSLRRTLAAALARAGRFQESADELGRWVEAAPADPAVRIMFARLLADLGRSEESERQLAAAMEIVGVADLDGLVGRLIGQSGTDAQFATMRELAQLLDRTNRTDELRSLLDQAEQNGIIRDRFGYPAAAAALRDGAAEDARRILLKQPPEADAVRWHWLMSRIADALGDTDSAFAEAEAMNLSQPDVNEWRARGQEHLGSIREVAAGMTREWAGALKTVSPDKRGTPAFLVGFPRSGTTLLDTFLLGHPDTAVLEEIPLFEAAHRALGGMLDLPERSEAELRAARDAYFEALGRHVDPAFAGLIIDKLPLNMLAAPYLYSLFPDAKFIFAQRHPCDCVLSCFMQGFAMNASMACFLDIEMAADYYDAAMHMWIRSKDVLPIRVHTLVYEELVADPERTLRPLVDFLGLEWRDELLDHRATARARVSIATPSYNQVTQPLTRAPSGRWKRYEKQLRPVLPQLLQWAERLGYAERGGE